jgi:hypothetical protein
VTLRRRNRGTGPAAAQAAGYSFGERTDAPRLPVANEDGAQRLERYFREHNEGPGLWKWLHYFEIYERHLGRFGGRAEVHVLEIGIYSGGSIGMWRDYFGDSLRFYGVDIEPDCNVYQEEHVDIFIGDQADPAFWRETLPQIPRLDVVIDDGGHVPYQQIATLEATLPVLAPGGVYLCEDIHDTANDFHEYIAGLSRNLNSKGSGTDGYTREPIGFQRLVHSIHLYPFVTVIERREHQLEMLHAPKMGTRWQPFYDPDWRKP